MIEHAAQASATANKIVQAARHWISLSSSERWFRLCTAANAGASGRLCGRLARRERLAGITCWRPASRTSFHGCTSSKERFTPHLGALAALRAVSRRAREHHELPERKALTDPRGAA